MSAGARRLERGGRIDRQRPIRFTLDGRAFTGFAGDTLASALLAGGARIIGRSFKYHRARGFLSAGVEEPNGLFTLGSGARTTPNVPGTVTELTEGLSARCQNGWPSVGFDLMAVLSLAAPLLGAGFYYKTFMGPRRGSWEFYEPFIRRAAGLGRARHNRDPDRYETRYAHTDVLVIGAGPAGLSAALAAGRSGARVLLVEQDFLLGGELLSAGAAEPGAVARVHGGASWRSCPMSRCSPAPPPSGSTTAIRSPCWNGATTRSRILSAGRRASSSRRCARAPSSLPPAPPSGRWSSSTTICPG